MYVQLTVSHHRSNYSKEKALGMTYWINTQLSILSMQIEIEVLHLPLDFRKAQWKTWYMHPFPPCYPPPLKGWQLHHSESKFWSQYLAAQRYFFFFFFFPGAWKNLGPIDITGFHFFSLLPDLPLLFSSYGSVWPPNTLLLFSIWNIHSGITWCFSVFILHSAYTVLAKCKTNWAF